MLVLDGNIPRFPWEPSTTTLTYRLASTTEGFGVLPGRTPKSVHTTMSMWRASSRASATSIFARPGEHHVLWVADLGRLSAVAPNDPNATFATFVTAIGS